jgi:hypothetical protein
MRGEPMNRQPGLKRGSEMVGISYETAVFLSQKKFMNLLGRPLFLSVFLPFGTIDVQIHLWWACLETMQMVYKQPPNLSQGQPHLVSLPIKD